MQKVGKLKSQKMADLPVEHITPSQPFTFVGVGCFRSLEHHHKTHQRKKESPNLKTWAVLFICLYCRAVHIEVIDEMSSFAFVNALCRFKAIRWRVTEFRSDRGTNFVGAVSELHINAVNVEDNSVRTYLEKADTVWHFNPPHSSHFGGVWERLIGIACRILDSMLLDQKHSKLTHEVLTTLIAEVTAIMNSRPLVPVSIDSKMPLILSPNMLLTQKSGDMSASF